MITIKNNTENKNLAWKIYKWYINNFYALKSKDDIYVLRIAIRVIIKHCKKYSSYKSVDEIKTNLLKLALMEYEQLSDDFMITLSVKETFITYNKMFKI